ncbi:MAG: hypothetical protein ACI94Y_002144 [Maribacter sp.]|jgi:hypothetical protein
MKTSILILFLMLPMVIFAQDDGKKTFYNTFDLSFHAANSDQEYVSQHLQYTKGIGLKSSMGYHWKYWMDFGVGIGFDMYRMDNTVYEKKYFVPLFVEIRGKVLDKKIAPYYELGIGYAFNLTKTSWDFYHKNGGVYFRPTAGYQFEMKNDFMMSVYVGYQLQKEENKRDYDDNPQPYIGLPEGIEFYQRMVMGIKLGF